MSYTKWIISDNQIKLAESDNYVRQVSSLDIFELEQGESKPFVSHKPSYDLPEVRFLDTISTIKLCVNKDVSTLIPVISVSLSIMNSFTGIHNVTFVPDVDHVLLGNTWHPLSDEEIQNINDILDFIDCPNLGSITLPQYLKLISQI